MGFSDLRMNIRNHIGQARKTENPGSQVTYSRVAHLVAEIQADIQRLVHLYF